MRGGAQSHLIQASDDHYYVVKFRNNPQHRRILVNELIAAEILKYLQIAAPPSELVQISADFLRDHPEVHIQLGSQHIQPDTGWAFGSRYPGDPNLTAVYDFVPDTLLGQVENRLDFLAALVFDKWAGNADGRQSIFFRAQLQEWVPQLKPKPRKMGFVALMIDHGFIFNGPHWNFVESAVQGVYPRRSVYESVVGLESFEPWLTRVREFLVWHLGFWHRYAPRRADGSYPEMQRRETWTPRSPLESLLARSDDAAHAFIAEALIREEALEPALVPPSHAPREIDDDKAEAG